VQAQLWWLPETVAAATRRSSNTFAVSQKHAQRICEAGNETRRQRKTKGPNLMFLLQAEIPVGAAVVAAAQIQPRLPSVSWVSTIA